MYSLLRPLIPLLLSLLVLCLAPGASAQGLDVRRVWFGEFSGDQYGISVCLPGDLDGDGIADIAVGASANDDGGNAAGKVYVYRGENPPDSLAWMTSTGSAGDFLGAALAGAGDVNDDGFQDLLLGAHRSSEGGVSSGKALVYFGGPGMDGVADVALSGPPGGRLGTSVAGIGDQNGDGVDDFIVGVPRAGNGEVWILFGGNPPDSVADFKIRGQRSGERFGQAVSRIDDMNGDGVSEVLIGAPRNSQNGVWSGRVYIFYGGAYLDTIPDWTVGGEGSGDEFGRSLGPLGDVNDDGASDLIVGAPFANDTFLDQGKAYVFFGGAAPDTVADLVIVGSGPEDYAGKTVGYAGDINLDGHGDFMVGIPGSDGGGLDAGKVRIFFGGTGVDAISEIEVDGEAGDRWGEAIAGGDDVGGQGKASLIVGSWAPGPGKSILYESQTTPVGVPVERPLPDRFLMLGAFPNPFSLSTRIVFELPEVAFPRIAVYDIQGCRVATLMDGKTGRPAGDHEVYWNGRDSLGQRVAAGFYLIRIEALGQAEVIRLVALPTRYER